MKDRFGEAFLRCSLIAAVCLAAASASCARAPAPAGAGVRGAGGKGSEPLVVRVAFREAPAPGTRVLFLRSPAEDRNPAMAGITGEDGKSSAEIAPGKYFLLAEWRRDGDYTRLPAPGDRFAWFGGNPIYVAPGGPRELFLGLEELVAPPVSVPGSEGVTGAAGVVLAAGVPVRGVSVSAYLKPDGGFRDMGFVASAPTGPDGSFVLDLPPGKYYLVARKRAGGGVAGPLRKGDLQGYYAGNPVAVTEGAVVRVAIPATPLRLRNAPFYSGESPAAAFIEGRILDASGNPVAGVYAALYDNPELLNRPLFLSDTTGKDGRYRLPVPVPGTYFLGARTGYGGAPAPGDSYGRYEGTPDHAVTVRPGDRLTGIDVVVSGVIKY